MNADQKTKAAALHKLYKPLRTLIRVLDSDVQYAREQWRPDPSSQFWRRTFVRCCCARAEGTLSVLKNAVRDIADYFGVQLTEKEIAELVFECRAFLKPRENVKRTFKVFARAHGVPVAIKYDETGFADLCDTFILRNRLMHPRGLFDLEVTDKAIDAAVRGEKWFGCVLTNVLQECGKKLPFR